MLCFTFQECQTEITAASTIAFKKVISVPDTVQSDVGCNAALLTTTKNILPTEVSKTLFVAPLTPLQSEPANAAGALPTGFKTDSSNPPTTIRARTNVVSGSGGFVISPVKKNDYVLVEVTTGSTTNYFIPIGN